MCCSFFPGIFTAVNIWGQDAVLYGLFPTHNIIRQHSGVTACASLLCLWVLHFKRLVSVTPHFWEEGLGICPRWFVFRWLCVRKKCFNPFWSPPLGEELMGSAEMWSKLIYSGFHVQVPLCSSVVTTVLLFWTKIDDRNITSTNCFTCNL